MADNITLNVGTGGATAASDDISGVHFQRIKVALGADGVHDGDVSSTNPMPTRAITTSTSGSISAANASYSATSYSAAPTANSYVDSPALDGYGFFTVSVLGTFSGTLRVHATIDETNWFPLTGSIAVSAGDSSSNGMSSVGIYRGSCAGFKKIRITNNNSWTSGTANVVLFLTNSQNLLPTNGTQIPVTIGTTLTTTSTLTAAAGTGVLSSVSSTSLEASKIIKASSGKLHLLTVTNSGSAQFLQIFNSASVPADGATPDYVYYLPAASTITMDYTAFGRRFGTGISVCNSSTLATKTIGSADCFFMAEYI